jgi:hypothetical protein
MIELDWSAIATWTLGAFFAALVFAVVFFIAARMLFYEVMSHPSVQALVRVAQKLGGKGAGGILQQGLGWLMKQLKGATE